MKYTNKLFSFIAFIFLLSTQKAVAQTTQEEVISFMEDVGWTVTGDSRYAQLREGGYTTLWYRTFHPGLEYAIVAFSEDDDVEDMDLELRYTDGSLYDRDDDPDDWAIVTFQPPSILRLGIKMKNYSSQTPYFSSMCRYIVFYR